MEQCPSLSSTAGYQGSLATAIVSEKIINILRIGRLILQPMLGLRPSLSSTIGRRSHMISVVGQIQGRRSTSGRFARHASVTKKWLWSGGRKRIEEEVTRWAIQTSTWTCQKDLERHKRCLTQRDRWRWFFIRSTHYTSPVKCFCLADSVFSFQITISQTIGWTDEDLAIAFYLGRQQRKTDDLHLLMTI